MCISSRLFLTLAAALLVCITPASAQQDTAGARIHIVYMGGNDCPPCVSWRATELPKLQKTEAFKTVKFSFVVKTIMSPVPASFFLPADVKPYKEKLDYASGGTGGSPHFAILVNDQVYDYFFGTKPAEHIEKMIVAIRTNSEYPHKRCVKLDAQRHCAGG
jgi:hypothetical protein